MGISIIQPNPEVIEHSDGTRIYRTETMELIYNKNSELHCESGPAITRYKLNPNKTRSEVESIAWYDCGVCKKDSDSDFLPPKDWPYEVSKTYLRWAQLKIIREVDEL